MEVKHAKDKRPHKLLDNVSGAQYAGQVRRGFGRPRSTSMVHRARTEHIREPACFKTCVHVYADDSPYGS